MAKKCHICGLKIKGEQANCLNCTTNLITVEEELIRSDFVAYQQGKANIAGNAILTTRRLLFTKDDKNSTAAMLFGLVGAAVAAAASSGMHPILFEIPRGGIQRIETGVVGLFKDPTITLFATSGEEYMLVPSKKQFPEMKEAYELQL